MTTQPNSDRERIEKSIDERNKQIDDYAEHMYQSANFLIPWDSQDLRTIDIFRSCAKYLIQERAANNAEIQQLKADCAVKDEALKLWSKQLDQLLAHCDKEGGECSICSKIICPFEDEMHFHHDGCPSCHTCPKDNPIY